MLHAIRCIFQSINRDKNGKLRPGLVLRHFLTYAVIELTVLAVDREDFLSQSAHTVVAHFFQSRLVGFRLAYVLAVGLRLPHDLRQPPIRNQAGARDIYS